MSSSATLLRLPSPPERYEEGYMARLVNTLELEKQSTYFAASIGLTNAVNQAEAVAWFIASTDATTVYTAPAATTSIVKSILVSEDSGNADTITATITDTASAVFSLFKVKAVAANTTVELLTAPLIVQESEVLKFTAATANRLHVVVSVLEIS